LEELVLTKDLKSLQKCFQKTILKTKENLQISDSRIYDQKFLLKELIREEFLRNFADKFYGQHVYYSLTWLKLLQKENKSILLN
jgi:hypothetical protein